MIYVKTRKDIFYEVIIIFWSSGYTFRKIELKNNYNAFSRDQEPHLFIIHFAF